MTLPRRRLPISRDERRERYHERHKTIRSITRSLAIASVAVASQLPPVQQLLGLHT